uniref:Polyhedrin n=1 Tax=Operophtera brumata cypovirus 18 TaxID=352244 RepID=UPI00045BAB61|nr:Chain A, Polyhedrin [Operophtera brumata cypovirus 18]
AADVAGTSNRDFRGREQRLYNSEQYNYNNSLNGEVSLWVYAYYSDGSVLVRNCNSQYKVGISECFKSLKEVRVGQNNDPYDEQEVNNGVYYPNGGEPTKFHSNAKPRAIQIIFSPSVNVHTIKMAKGNSVSIPKDYLQRSHPWEATGVKYRKIHVDGEIVGYSHYFELPHEYNSISLSVSGVHKNPSSYNVAAPHNIMDVFQSCDLALKFSNRYWCELELINHYISAYAYPYLDINNHKYGVPLNGRQ